MVADGPLTSRSTPTSNIGVRLVGQHPNAGSDDGTFDTAAIDQHFPGGTAYGGTHDSAFQIRVNIGTGSKSQRRQRK